MSGSGSRVAQGWAEEQTSGSGSRVAQGWAEERMSASGEGPAGGRMSGLGSGAPRGSAGERPSGSGRSPVGEELGDSSDSKAWHRAIKRAFDVGVAGSLLVAAAPLALGVAACVRWRLGAPVLFKQTRAGKHGRPFTLYKFRSMGTATDPQGAPLPDAVRLTPLGRRLRASSLDELPQLWNVLRGDMSLVGPRPLLMQYLPRYSPAQARRHEVPPGITGWAQVGGRNALAWEERFNLDVWYIDHWSLALDARILGLTALRILQREGIQNADHATMPEFMGAPSPQDAS